MSLLGEFLQPVGGAENLMFGYVLSNYNLDNLGVKYLL